jgi:hypothetical protein
MKNFLQILCFAVGTISASYSNAQCGAGYTQAQLKWDNLDYYYNSGGGTPYNSYVTDAMAQTQKFAIGVNSISFFLSSLNSFSVNGENISHTGESGSYGTGADAQFTTSTNSVRTITLTFGTEVKDLKFSLYDIDNNQRVTVAAKNALNVSQSIILSKPGGGSVTIAGSPGTAPTGTGSGSVASSSNAGTVNIDIAGPVNSVVLSFDNAAGDFWLSDITACVLGAFPTNYHQLSSTTNGVADNQPFTGPTQNQADYFLVTPDNQWVYYTDPATGKTYSLFTDAAKPFVNSLAYDPVNRILYYVTDGSPSSPQNNKSLKKYDLSTGSISTVIADVTTTLNIPTFDLGIESAGAAFYNGSYYLGIEGGRYNSSTTRKTIVYRIDFDASLSPAGAAQVFATPAYDNSTGASIHDWGDFIIKDGILYDFNTARSGGSCGSYNWSNSSVIHYDMTGGNVTFTYPHTGLSSATFGGQVGMNWAGNIYTFWYNCNPNPDVGGVQKYNLNGTFAANANIIVVAGQAWPGGAGDASDPFRPKCDFGDAPVTYDPNPVSPAVHERSDNIRLGNARDSEMVKKGITGTEDADDGLAFVQVLDPNAGTYLTQASVFNNSGANATVCAWLDYNGNGVFNASEGITVTVPSSASSQLIWLYWPSISTSIPLGNSTYLRVRITSASAGMTTAMPTGFFFNGEVEDYRVTVNSWGLLSIQNSDFNAQLTKANTAKLTWGLTDECDIIFYSIEKSTNNSDWSPVKFVSTQMKPGPVNYEVIDGNVSNGITYYRLKTTQKNGQVTTSVIKQITNKVNRFSLSVTPNPAISKAVVNISSAFAERATLEVINNLGMVVYKTNLDIKKGTNSVELPASGFVSGTYVVNLFTGSQSVHQSLIINK